MFQPRNEDISSWAGRIDTLMSRKPDCVVQRVVVIESTDTTQHAAIRFARRQHGLLVIASKQNNGRGSFGRRWHDGDRATLPCTFVIDPCCIDATAFSACVACAVHETIASFMPRTVRVAIKWPNDIVVLEDDRERKIGGVLIEKVDGLTLVGIGINCTQAERDWSPEFRSRAVSFLGLGVSVSRLDLVCSLIESLTEWLRPCDPNAVREYYEHYNAMVGTERVFRYNNTIYTGIVEHMDPLGSITIESAGNYHTLPIAQTQHVRSFDGELASD
jgi:biotin-[acetyl-CoA-carboxylase] ligase BirA-like protein